MLWRQFVSMYENPELIKKWKDAHEKYMGLKEQVMKGQIELAQEANDAWNKFKQIDIDVNNYSTLRKLGELYGC
jgi:hypothetical protein